MLYFLNRFNSSCVLTRWWQTIWIIILKYIIFWFEFILFFLLLVFHFLQFNLIFLFNCNFFIFNLNFIQFYLKCFIRIYNIQIVVLELILHCIIKNVLLFESWDYLSLNKWIDLNLFKLWVKQWHSSKTEKVIKLSLRDHSMYPKFPFQFNTLHSHV